MNIVVCYIFNITNELNCLLNVINFSFRKGAPIPYGQHAIHASSSYTGNQRTSNLNSPCTTPSPSTMLLAPPTNSQHQMLLPAFYGSGRSQNQTTEKCNNHHNFMWSSINSPTRPDGYLVGEFATPSSSSNPRGCSPPPQQLVRNLAGRRTVHGGTVHDRKKIEATLVGVSKLTIDGEAFGSACDARLGWTESEKRRKEASKEDKKTDEKSNPPIKPGKSIGRSGRFSFLNKLASKLGRS